jgi:PAS domain S-box-containing protein
MAVWAIDTEGRVTSSPELNRLVGLPDDARPTLDELQAQYAPGELERLQGLAVEILARGERYFEAEYRHIRANNGLERWLLVRAEFLFDGNSTTPSSIGVVFDITERKETEYRLGLLAQEVDHRANNLLAVVQSALALTQAENVADFKDALAGRLSALARAHQLLAASRWVGADIHRLVEEELSPYRVTPADRISINGPRLELAPQTAQAVAMVVHELATNAVKHGALRNPDGRLFVEWHLEAGPSCELSWREVGPNEISPPSRRGMGSRVIARALGGALNGSTELHWEPDGLKAELRFPVLA